jgi:hypothetical protein
MYVTRLGSNWHNFQAVQQEAMIDSVTRCYNINPLRTDSDFCHQGRDTEIAQIILRLSKPTDMNIFWKALSDGTISCSIQPMFGKSMHFLYFPKKISILKELIDITRRLIQSLTTAIIAFTRLSYL